MNIANKPIDRLVYELKERAKELNCLYEIQELVNTPEISLDEICEGIVRVIPPGWQYPDVCMVKIYLFGKIYKSHNFVETDWMQSADILVQDDPIGRINVYYSEERPDSDEGPFLKEERKLIDTIAEQLGHYFLQQQLKEVFEEHKKSEKERRGEWWVIINLLKRTDPNLLMRISRKMVNYLYWSGVQEAEGLLEQFGPVYRGQQELLDENRPYQLEIGSGSQSISDEVFELAGGCLSEREILDNIQQWIKEDQSGFLLDTLVSPSSSLAEISTAIERYHHLANQGLELSRPRQESVRVALIRRILNDEPQYVQVAKRYLAVDDFHRLIQKTIFPVGSHGKLGGKSSGLFLATQILKDAAREDEIIRGIKTPKTWYIASDNLFHFMSYNNLEDIVEQKYKDINQVRQEYPYVIHVFKSAALPPEIIKGLSLALDEFGDVPLIVRSSSLLEDSMGLSFAGKYKSLFIANQGRKDERLTALVDAIAEVYASSFGPDPIKYRVEHGMLDFHEEMGIMIQEVVGERVGKYFFPAFAGVAFSNNDFRWSSRIRREDGLIRIVPGLGTRAVDRLSDDYPMLISPGQPGLRVNVTLDEFVRYSPKKIDVINLETGSFETVDVSKVLREYGREYPALNQLVSVFEEDHMRQYRSLGVNFEKNNLVITFEGLIQRTPFLKQMHAVLNILQSTFNHPVDIEFASDGKDIYLLQCRSQSYSEDSRPAKIPGDVPLDRIIFSANRYISNGKIDGVLYVVYVNPQKYSELSNQQDLLDVGRAIGKLNNILPKREFILMGPGRWGSRGDIKLGVNVTYSDINNTCMLIEIARKQKDYMPDPSFGTHFFQDLVEASIKYLPLYPDDHGIVFNEEFLTTSENKLPDILPEFTHLRDVIRVINVSDEVNGGSLQILMNAEKEKAVGLLSRSSSNRLERRKHKHKS